MTKTRQGLSRDESRGNKRLQTSRVTCVTFQPTAGHRQPGRGCTVYPGLGSGLFRLGRVGATGRPNASTSHPIRSDSVINTVLECQQDPYGACRDLERPLHPSSTKGLQRRRITVRACVGNDCGSSVLESAWWSWLCLSCLHTIAERGLHVMAEIC